MTRRLRSIGSLALVAASLTATAACTSPATTIVGHHPRPALASVTCDGGTFLYRDITTADVLTGVTSVIVLTKAGPVPVTTPVQQIARAEAYVAASEQVPQNAAYQALVDKTGGQALPLGTFRDGSQAVQAHRTRRAGDGCIFFSGVRTATSTFDYECGGTAYSGSTTVLLIDESGVTDCPPSQAAHRARWSSRSWSADARVPRSAREPTTKPTAKPSKTPQTTPKPSRQPDRVTIAGQRARGCASRVHLAQPVDGDQRVDLRRGDRRVAEQLLHHPHVGAAVEQVRGVRVAQRVRRHLRRRAARHRPPRGAGSSTPTGGTAGRRGR